MRLVEHYRREDLKPLSAEIDKAKKVFRLCANGNGYYSVMKSLAPFELDIHVEAVLTKVASKCEDGMPIADLIRLDKTLSGPLWEAARMGWLEVRATSNDPVQLVASLELTAATELLTSKGAIAHMSSIGLVLLLLLDHEEHERSGSDRYTARVKMEDFGRLAENCLGAEYEQHLIANRYLPRGIDDKDIELEHRRAALNHRIWQEGIELARSWCETLAKYPEFVPYRNWLRKRRKDLGRFAKMDPATGAGSTLKSIEKFQERLDGWRVISPATTKEHVRKRMSSTERDEAIMLALRKNPRATSESIADEIGCGASNIRMSGAWKKRRLREKASGGSRPRKGGHSKQRSLESIEPQAAPTDEQKFFDDLPDEDREYLDQTDTDYGTRGGHWD